MEISEKLWEGRLLPKWAGACLSIGYKAGLALRERGYNLGILKTSPLDIPVISIGNLTVGGTGKTPLTMVLGRHLGETYKVAVVSRGYKRESPQDPLIVSNGKEVLASPQESGDEPYLMARSLPGVAVVVGSNRYQAAKLAVEQLNTQVVLLDDGFQNKRIKKDLELLLIDAHKGFGNCEVLPAGPLREPLEAARRADLAILVKKGDAPVNPRVAEMVKSTVPHLPIETVEMGLVGLKRITEGNLEKALPIEELKGTRVVAFCGIGNPNSFFRMLEEKGLRVVEKRVFPDHHRYSQKELAAIVEVQRSLGCPYVVTTAKDAVNLPPPPYPEDLLVAELGIKALPKRLLEIVEMCISTYYSPIQQRGEVKRR